MDPILPLLAALGGTLLGGAIAYLNSSVQWKRQQAASRKQILSAKLESVCELVIDIQLGLSSAWAETQLRILSISTPSKEATKDRKRIPLEHLKMLASLYFESLLPHAKAVIEARDQLGKFVAESISSPPSDSRERETAIAGANAAYKLVEKACDAFLAEAAKIAKDLV
jgi:hypothetical protein